eukprot:COSAG02_NODE_1039_length_15040_cov_70.746737_8_plen_150_part_00
MEEHPLGVAARANSVGQQDHVELTPDIESSGQLRPNRRMQLRPISASAPRLTATSSLSVSSTREDAVADRYAADAEGEDLLSRPKSLSQTKSLPAITKSAIPALPDSVNSHLPGILEVSLAVRTAPDGGPWQAKLVVVHRAFVGVAVVL